MHDFRLFLQSELVSRCRKNPRYSLRSFARALGVNHGILSLVLRNKRALTIPMIQQMGLALKLSKQELDNYVLALPTAGTRTRKSESTRQQKIKQMNQMTIDVFSIVSDWYHDAILELSRVRGFRPHAKYISARLGITVSEARAAIERLERAGLIEILPNGTWRETLGDNTTAIDVDLTSTALRDLQRQVLARSLHALETVPKRQRDHSCTTLAIDARDLMEAKRRIRAFRHELMAYLQRNGTEFNEVFQLAVSFYPLTKSETGSAEL